MELTDQGMQFSRPADPNSDVVALLGGFAMPKSNVKPEEVNEILRKDT